MLRFFGSICRRHFRNLFPQSLYFSLFFVKETFLLLDFFCIDNNLFLGNQSLIKGAFGVILSVAVINPLNEFKQSLQCKKHITAGNMLFCMDCHVAELDDKGQFFPGLLVHLETEGRLVNEGLQVIPIGQGHSAVSRINPLDCQLQRLAAANGTHGRGRGIDPFRLDSGRGKKRIFFFLF